MRCAESSIASPASSWNGRARTPNARQREPRGAVDSESLVASHSTPRRMSRAGGAENTDLALRAQGTRRRNGTDQPPSLMIEKQKEGGRRHLFSAIFALSARDSYSPRSLRARF